MILGPPTWASGSWANAWASSSWSVTGITGTSVSVLLAGLEVRTSVRKGSITIRDLLNDAPNTCAFKIGGTAPTVGQSVRVVVNSVLLFNGTIQTVDMSYEGKPTQNVWACTAIDDIARLNERRPFGTWVDTSVTTIAQSIITAYAPGFTTVHVQAGLPTVSIIFDGTDDFSTCLARLAKAIGGYFYVEDLDLHLFTVDATDSPLDLDSTPGRFLDDPPIQANVDRTQLITRQCGKGHGEAVPVDVLAGETIIPVEDAVMFNPAGGKVIAGTTPDGAQSQILTYTGIQLGGGGALVGPSISPSTPLVATLAAGAGLGLGVYQYAYTDVTAIGETVPSPVTTITTRASETVPTPTVAPTVASESIGLVNQGGSTAPDWNGTDASTGPHIGDTLQYAYTWSTSTNPADLTFSTAISPLSAVHTVPSYLGYGGGWITAAIPRVTLPLPDSRVKYIHLYRKRNGGTLFFTGTVINANGNNGYQAQDISITGTVVPATPNAITAEQKQVALSGIALGPTGTTARKVYRTTAGGSQLKLQQTIANNTATTGVTDVTADGSLGANAPTADTAGLTGVVSVGQGFYTGAALTANGAATLATTAPVFTSANYTFVAGDIGATIYIKAGTNWIVGRYLILNVIAGAAYLDAPCASVASPTTGTWGIDYSALPTQARFTYTDIVVDATFTTKITSAAQPFGSNVLGNVLVFGGGIGFTAQRVIAMAFTGAAGLLTCDKAVGVLNATAGQATILGTTVLTQVNAGSTSIPTAGAGAFSTTGGWAVTNGGSFVRYTGLSGNTLTGIPASGVGAILTTLLYGSPIVSAPALTGVTGLTLAMQKGTPVSIWVQRDNLGAQAAQIALDLAQGRVSTGIVEGPPIVDERRGEPSLMALCDATLAKLSSPIVTVTYAARDMKTKSGKTIVVNLASPAISQTLTIQSVTITEIDIAPNLAPKFHAVASSIRFSLEALLVKLAA